MANLPTTLKPTIRGTGETIEYKVVGADFAGYDQTTSLGINNAPRKVKVDFYGTKPQIQVYVDFFDVLLGSTRFTWTPDYETVERDWKCSQISRAFFSDNSGQSVHKLTCSFKEVF